MDPETLRNKLTAFVKALAWNSLDEFLRAGYPICLTQQKGVLNPIGTFAIYCDADIVRACQQGIPESNPYIATMQSRKDDYRPPIRIVGDDGGNITFEVDGVVGAEPITGDQYI